MNPDLFSDVSLLTTYVDTHRVQDTHEFIMWPPPFSIQAFNYYHCDGVIMVLG